MALSLALSACAQFGGRTDDAGTQVSVATPTAWTSTDPSIVTAAPSPESLAGWWRQFGDAQLDALIAEAMMAIVLMDHLLRHRGQNADVRVSTPVLGQL